MAAFANVTKEMGLVKVIKVTGRKKSPCSRMSRGGSKGRVPAL